MSRRVEEILEEARQLPPEEVDWLIEFLLIRDQAPSEEEESSDAIEAAWGSEIKSRLDEIDSGAVKMIPGEEVMAKMLARLSPQARARMRL
jgi:hypothetical protein